MIAKRIIPCLDIKDGRTVKGTCFTALKDMGDPVALAAYYAAEGADELVLLDISAGAEGRSAFPGIVRDVARELDIPFTVGGGIRAVSDVQRLLAAGADKVSVNTAAVLDPGLISGLAGQFGTQCVVIAIDSRQEADGDWYVYINGGKTATGIRTEDWALTAMELGAGELLLTAINHDGMQQGFALAHTAALSQLLHIPVIASGGAGNEVHFRDVFREGKADAALAAGIFHTGRLRIPGLKQYLQTQNINIRPYESDER